MKVYTKTGDKGMTALVGGKRVAKNSVRLEAYGTVDELNSHLGMLRSYPIESALVQELVEIQSRLFDLGSYLATESADGSEVAISINESDVEYMEHAIDRMNDSLEPMKYFIVPGGHPLISHAHIARTVCRRAERRIIDLNDEVALNPLAIIYVNRLSDYLFVISRWFAHTDQVEEHKWIPKKS